MSRAPTSEAVISHSRIRLLVLAASLGAGSSPAAAQDAAGTEGIVWHLEELHQGFCVQLLVDPAAVARRLPRGARTLPADQVADLHPALRGAIDAQPELSSRTPSRLCLFYFGRVDAAGRRASNDDPRKAPMLGLWTVAVADSASGERTDVALEVFTNNSRIERAGEIAGLDLARARSTVGDVPEDEEGRPSADDRYQIRLGKLQITWDGRPAGDSARPDAPLSAEWRAEGRRGGWVDGSLTIGAATTSGMIGSLKVHGKGDLARLLMQSPVRFVGPGYRGGGGSVTLRP